MFLGSVADRVVRTPGSPVVDDRAGPPDRAPGWSACSALAEVMRTTRRFVLLAGLTLVPPAVADPTRPSTVTDDISPAVRLIMRKRMQQHGQEMARLVWEALMLDYPGDREHRAIDRVAAEVGDAQRRRSGAAAAALLQPHAALQGARRPARRGGHPSTR